LPLSTLQISPFQWFWATRCSSPCGGWIAHKNGIN
jgi:hypothetical protein